MEKEQTYPRKNQHLKLIALCMMIIFLTSCATMQPKKYQMNIDLLTVDPTGEPIAAVCTLYSSSGKIDVLAPKKFNFLSECSSLNIICKSDELSGEHGVIKKEESSAAGNFIINSGIGYVFDRAVESVTPLGTFLNFMSEDEGCDADRSITIVLE